MIRNVKQAFIGFRLDKDIKDRLEIVAISQNRSLSNLLECMIFEYLNDFDFQNDKTVERF